MKIQRYIAKDMRSALAQVREDLGADAVILSSGKVGNEVEVVAAMDLEVARAVESAAPPREARRFEPPRVDQPRAELPTLAGAHVTQAAQAAPVARRASSQISATLAPVIAAAQPAPPALPAPQQEALASEMKDMRRMLETQLATLAWNDMSRRSPIQAAML